MTEEAALAWVIRVRDPDFADWEAFTRWLEGDPAHARAYDRLAAIDADLPAALPHASPARHPAPVIPANDQDAPPRRWRWVAGGGIAAVAAALVAFVAIPRADPYSVATAPGQTREIALADGTKIVLNGGTTVRLDHARPRLAALEKGEALFTVTHDPRDPFRVQVGDAVFEDVGTVFNISHAGGMTRIGVSEGAVVYNPQAEAIALPAGRGLTARDADGTVQLAAVAPDAVGSWRTGRLTYNNAPMDEIAADIARSLGVPVRAAPGVATMHFTGTILIDRDAGHFFARAAPLLGVSARRRDGAWMLEPQDAAPR
ncbi:FecR family protein [Sphingobium aquiterrae]|uniref:FecR family protein n=1 Tax=Sphingobium aquiterrae TaxID=2038656 RepID=UPI0030173F85